jgi:hypothetical protein
VSRNSFCKSAPGRTVGAGARALAERAGRVDAADVDAAEERGAPVDDQQLAVIALVQLPAFARQQRIDGVELEHVDAAVGQALEKLGRCAERADAVADQVDLHALLLLGDQRLCKPLADLIVFEDVGLHVDVILRRADGRDHGLVGRRTVLEQTNVVAGGQRAAGHGLFERQMALEHVARFAAGLQPVEHGLALRTRQRPARPFHLRWRLRARRQVGHEARQAAARAQTEGQGDRDNERSPTSDLRFLINHRRSVCAVA